MIEQNKNNEWSTITDTLPDFCRKFTKLDERGRTVLQLEKNENNEWRDVTPVVAQSQRELKLRAQIAALELKLKEINV